MGIGYHQITELQMSVKDQTNLNYYTAQKRENYFFGHWLPSHNWAADVCQGPNKSQLLHSTKKRKLFLRALTTTGSHNWVVDDCQGANTSPVSDGCQSKQINASRVTQKMMYHFRDECHGYKSFVNFRQSREYFSLISNRKVNNTIMMCLSWMLNSLVPGLRHLTLTLLADNLTDTKWCKTPQKMTEALTHGYSSERNLWELSNEYPHDRV